MKLLPLVYAGIGSRETPEDVLVLMEAIGAWLAQRGWTLRSGGAKGADTYFDRGCRSVAGKHEIYVPKPDHLLYLRPGTEYDPAYMVPELVFGPVVWKEAEELAARFHGGFSNLDDASATLITRNGFQVLGPDLASPASMIVCWAEGSKFDGAGRIQNVKGGTGQAVRLAHEHGIPVYNLALPAHRALIEATIGYRPQAAPSAPAGARPRSRRP